MIGSTPILAGAAGPGFLPEAPELAVRVGCGRLHPAEQAVVDATSLADPLVLLVHVNASAAHVEWTSAMVMRG